MMSFKTGKVYKYRGLEFYACCGIVRIHDNRTGEIIDKDPVEFLEHGFALAAALPRIDTYRERYECAEMANAVEACCNEAIEMGNPFDSKVHAYHSRHKAWKRCVIQVPGMPGGAKMSGSGLIIPEDSIR